MIAADGETSGAEILRVTGQQRQTMPIIKSIKTDKKMTKRDGLRSHF